MMPLVMVSLKMNNQRVLNRKDVSLFITENMLCGYKSLLLGQYSDYVHEGGMSENSMLQFVEVGIEEYLDLFFPYQERRIISFNK